MWDYNDAYILGNGTITITGRGTKQARKQTEKEVTFKNCAPFTDSISEIIKRQVDNAKDLDGVILMYNLTEYSDNYSKTS